VSHQIVWQERAIFAASQFLKDDQQGLAQAFDAVDLLSEEPRPQGSVEYGSPDTRRIHVGRYRVLYEIDEAESAIRVVHVGRVS
jgi:mRNA interferase RelE/StbE